MLSFPMSEKMTPEFPEAEAVEDLAEKIGKLIRESRNGPKLSLDRKEIKTMLQMDEAAFAGFLAEKGIDDFEKPVLLVTPDGTAEMLMKSADEVRSFLARNYGN